MAAFAVDSLSYNGWNFDNFVASRVKATPIYDDAKRMIKLVTFAIAIKGYIGATMPVHTTDDQLQKMKVQLESPGGILKYDSRGYGKFVINDPATGVWDCDWGPKPGEFNYTPLGMGYGCMYEYSITTSIPVCTGSAFQRALMMLNYSFTREIDEQGLTTQSVSGAIEIPLTFRNGLQLPDNVDAYKEMAIPNEVPIGFQRMGSRWDVSNDRKRAQFSYQEKELPVALPDGATMCDLQHRAKNKSPSGFTSVWTNEIGGTVRMNPRLPKITALDRFLTIALQRMQIAQDFAGPQVLQPQQPAQQQGGGWAGFFGGALVNGVDIVLGGAGNVVVGAAGNQNKPRVIPKFFEATEQIFGLSSRFSLTYDVIIPAGLSAVAKATGLWTPVGTDFTTWRDSLKDNANHPRGVARMRYQNSQDTLIDLCVPMSIGARVPNLSVGGTMETDEETLYEDDPTQVGDGAEAADASDLLEPLFDTSLPPAEVSWIAYNNWLTYVEDGNFAIHKPLIGTVTQTPSKVDPFDINALASQKDNNTGIKADTPDIVQRISSPSIRVILSGWGERLGYPVDPPDLITFGGSQVQKLKSIISPVLVGSANSTPIYRTTWNILYVVLTPPTTLPILANPMYPANINK